MGLSLAAKAAVGAVVGATRLCTGLVVSDQAAPADGWSVPAAAVTSGDTSGVWTDHVVIKLRAGTSASVVAGPDVDARVAALGRDWGVIDIRPTLEIPAANTDLAGKLGLDRFFTVSVPAGTDTVRLAERLGDLADLLELAEADPVGVLHGAPNDPAFSSQWALNNTAQSIRGVTGRADSDIDWLEAWRFPRPAATVIVAVLDTGVSASHPDLAGQTVPGRCFICGTGDPANTDDNLNLSHGTLCAGIIAAAAGNGLGISGIAPSARVMPVKVTSGLLASQTYTGNGLIWAVDHGAAIASMSWGFGATANVSFLQTAVQYASASGVLMVASTGNSPGELIGYPARWPEVIAVAATDSSDRLFAGATTGPEMDMVAPGVDIYTTVDQTDIPNGFTYATGTSMAAPMVAAAAATIWGGRPELTAEEIRQTLEASVDDLGEPGYDPVYGRGRLNMNTAMVLVMGPLFCAGDYDRNGSVELGDLFTFLSDYFQFTGQTGTGLHPDIDRNGVVSVEDIFAFMAVWLSPC